MGAFIDFLGNIFGKKSDGKVETISLKDYLLESESDRLCVDTYALWSAVEMLANLLANAEIKVYKRGVEEKGLLWAKLNYRPNVNQNATEFWREFYRKLLYTGEALAFETYDEQWLIADGFTKSDYEVKEKYFTDVYRGTFQASGAFPMHEVLYVNYPNENAAALKSGLLARYDKLIAAASESYENGTGKKVFLTVPGTFLGNEQLMAQYKDIVDNRFKSFFKQKNAVLPLWNNMQATFANSSTSGTATVKDITDLVTDGMTRAAQAYKIAPALLTGDVAGLKDAVDFTLTSAIDPLANVVSEQLSTCFYTLSEIAKNSKIYADTFNIKHRDVFDISGAVDKLISSGFATPNEVRGFAGLEPSDDESMDKHYITKNYGTTEDINGGGDNV